MSCVTQGRHGLISRPMPSLWIQMRALAKTPSPPPHPYSLRREGHWKGWALKLRYIKLPMYLFFAWRLDLMILMLANPLRFSGN
jgi:hypothetical protein